MKRENHRRYLAAILTACSLFAGTAWSAAASEETSQTEVQQTETQQIETETMAAAGVTEALTAVAPETAAAAENSDSQQNLTLEDTADSEETADISDTSSQEEGQTDLQAAESSVTESSAAENTAAQTEEAASEYTAEPVSEGVTESVSGQTEEETFEPTEALSETAESPSESVTEEETEIDEEEAAGVEQAAYRETRTFVISNTVKGDPPEDASFTYTIEEYTDINFTTKQRTLGNVVITGSGQETFTYTLSGYGYHYIKVTQSMPAGYAMEAYINDNDDWKTDAAYYAVYLWRASYFTSGSVEIKPGGRVYSTPVNRLSNSIAFVNRYKAAEEVYLQDLDTGVSVRVPASAIPEGISGEDLELRVKEITNSALAPYYSQIALHAETEELARWDIRLYNKTTGEEVQPTDAVELTFRVTSADSYNRSIDVFYLAGGECTLLNPSHELDSRTFQTSTTQLGYYYAVGYGDYDPASWGYMEYGTVSVRLSIDINGTETPPVGTVFTFDLSAVTEGAPMPAKTSASVTVTESALAGINRGFTYIEDLQAYFGEIVYTQPGTYWYVIKQRANPEAEALGYTLDASEKRVRVTVTENEDHTLRVKWTGESYDQGKIYGPALVFNNLYGSNKQYTVEIPIEKIIQSDREDGTYAPAEFTFRMLPRRQGMPQPQESVVTINGEGQTVLRITLTDQQLSGDWPVYIIEEMAGTSLGYTYTRQKYVLIIAYDRTLGGYAAYLGDLDSIDLNSLYYSRQQAFAIWNLETGSASEGAVFTNTYEETDTPSIAFPVEKQIKGDETNASDTEFTFTLEGVDGAPMPDTEVNGVSTLKLTGASRGQFDEITFYEYGTYRYVVKETAGSASGFSYDDTEYSIIVTVNKDGTVSWRAEGAEDVLTFVNTYTKETESESSSEPDSQETTEPDSQETTEPDSQKITEPDSQKVTEAETQKTTEAASETSSEEEGEREEDKKVTAGGSSGKKTGSSDQTADTSGYVKTGDESPLMLWIAVLALSGVMAGGLLRRRRADR